MQSLIILSLHFARIQIVCHRPEPQGDSVTLCSDSAKLLFATLLVHCLVHLEQVYKNQIQDIQSLDADNTICKNPVTIPPICFLNSNPFELSRSSTDFLKLTCLGLFCRQIEDQFLTSMLCLYSICKTGLTGLESEPIQAGSSDSSCLSWIPASPTSCPAAVFLCRFEDVGQ